MNESLILLKKGGVRKMLYRVTMTDGDFFELLFKTYSKDEVEEKLIYFRNVYKRAIKVHDIVICIR